MTRAHRTRYIKTAKALTKPLLDAYDLMLKEAITSTPGSSLAEDHLPLLDHFPTDNHSLANRLHSSHPLVLTSAMPALLQQEIEAMHIQTASDPSFRGPTLNSTPSLSPYTDFTLSDAALLWEPAAGTV